MRYFCAEIATILCVSCLRYSAVKWSKKINITELKVYENSVFLFQETECLLH